MVKNNNKSRKLRRRSNRNNTSVYVPPGAVSYNGPISIQNRDTCVVALLDNATISSAAVTGNIGANFDNNPSNARNWTELSTSYSEYRVLGIRYSYDPIYTVNTTTLIGFSGYHSIIHGSVVAPNSLAAAASTGIARRWNAFKPFSREWRMDATDEAVFQQTNAPSASSNTLIIYAEGGTVSTYYGNVLIEYLVEFRTHRL